MAKTSNPGKAGISISAGVLALLGLPTAALASEGFNFFLLIPWVSGLPHHVVAMTFLFVLLVVCALLLRRRFEPKEGQEDLVPGERFNLRNLFEIIAEATLSLMRDIIGPDHRRFFPLIGTCAFFILSSNLLGLIPGFVPATDSLNTTVACAIVVFFAYHYFGIREHGVLKYLQQFMGPMQGTLKWVMAPLMVPIELISHLARPLSLSLRLFGNIMGDHKVFAVFMGLTLVPLIYPLPFLLLGFLVAIVQTLVFCLLSMVYLSLAVSHEH